MWRRRCAMFVALRVAQVVDETAAAWLLLGSTARRTSATKTPRFRRPPSLRLYSATAPNSAPSTTVSNADLIRTGDRHGLLRYTVKADDGHPLRLYSRPPAFEGQTRHKPVLLLHGRTWSAQPVFDLRTSDTDERKQSLLQTLNHLGFAAYALDFRGFGETPQDGSGYTTPQRCVADVHAAVEWIQRECGADGGADLVGNKTALLGWSQGALVAQLYAQEHGRDTLSDLVLFGSIYDPRVIYNRRPLYEAVEEAPRVTNTEAAALEDFTLPGSICDEGASAFSNLALLADPIKCAWSELHEFNAVSPGLVQVPTMIIHGQQDPYVSWEAQRELFDRLGVDDKVWTVLPGCDHAAHILQRRHMFVRAVVGFLRRFDGPFDPKSAI